MIYFQARAALQVYITQSKQKYIPLRIASVDLTTFETRNTKFRREKKTTNQGKTFNSGSPWIKTKELNKKMTNVWTRQKNTKRIVVTSIGSWGMCESTEQTAMPRVTKHLGDCYTCKDVAVTHANVREKVNWDLRSISIWIAKTRTDVLSRRPNLETVAELTVWCVKAVSVDCRTRPGRDFEVRVARDVWWRKKRGARARKGGTRSAPNDQRERESRREITRTERCHASPRHTSSFLTWIRDVTRQLATADECSIFCQATPHLQSRTARGSSDAAPTDTARKHLPGSFKLFTSDPFFFLPFFSTTIPV